MNTASATQFLDVVGVDDLEFEPEFFEHLDAPFFLKRCRTDDEHAASAMPQQQFLNDETGLDRLAQTDIVRDQEIGAGHVDGADQRVELEILDAHSAAKRCLQESSIGVRRGTPSDGIQKCLQSFGIVLAGDGREPGLLDDVRARFDFPDDLDLLAEAVFVYRRQGDEMLR